jgi:hypothetical protein
MRAPKHLLHCEGLSVVAEIALDCRDVERACEMLGAPKAYAFDLALSLSYPDPQPDPQPDPRPDPPPAPRLRVRLRQRARAVDPSTRSSASSTGRVADLGALPDPFALIASSHPRIVRRRSPASCISLRHGAQGCALFQRVIENLKRQSTTHRDATDHLACRRAFPCLSP